MKQGGLIKLLIVLSVVAIILNLIAINTNISSPAGQFSTRVVTAVCGCNSNGVCEASQGETDSNCRDCVTCGDAVCSSLEDSTICPSDCPIAAAALTARADGSLYYNAFDGSTWLRSDIVSASVDEGASVSNSRLVLSSSLQPSIVYVKEVPGQPSALEYATHSGKRWAYETIDDNPAHAPIGHPSIALDSNDVPVVAFIATASMPALWAGYRAGPSYWQVTTAGSDSPVGRLAVAVPPGGTYNDMAVAYSTGTRLRYIHAVGGAFQAAQTVDTTSKGELIAPSLAFTSARTPLMVYYLRERASCGAANLGEKYTLKFSRYDASSGGWSIPSTLDVGCVTDGSEKDTSVAVDVADDVFVPTIMGDVSAGSAITFAVLARDAISGAWTPYWKLTSFELLHRAGYAISNGIAVDSRGSLFTVFDTVQQLPSGTMDLSKLLVIGASDGSISTPSSIEVVGNRQFPTIGADVNVGGISVAVPRA